MIMNEFISIYINEIHGPVIWLIDQIISINVQLQQPCQLSFLIFIGLYLNLDMVYVDNM